jgi:hypothetical protein
MMRAREAPRLIPDVTEIKNIVSLVTRWVVLAVVLCLLVPASVAAQDNPHGELSIECSDCHSTAAWSPLREPLEFDHAEVGRPLEKGHATLDCITCHESLVFRFVGTSCADCHEDPHRGELGFDCEACHQPASWDNRRSMADFHSVTLFPLTGIHGTVDCAACHRREPPFEYALTPTDCFSCHFKDYQATEDPNHLVAGLPTDCQLCHNTLGWEGVDFVGGFGFDHSALFQLTGEHARLECEDCHAGGYSGTPSACVACHRTEYDGTIDPNHKQAGFGISCENCHGTTTWEGAVSNHDSFFPLTGQHQALDCGDCHTAGFAGTPTDCVACHRDDYNSTSDPNHGAAGFGTRCEDCHTTSGWEGAAFVHKQFWPLNGLHRDLDCDDCHASGGAGTHTDCVACHLTDYNNTSNPDHQSAGISTDCEACHSTNGWLGAVADHNQFWPLTGSHAPLDCEECHADGFAGTPTDCNACHSADYDATVDPRHVLPTFPRDCEACHNTRTWDGAVFNHSFPIDSGAHREGEAWDDCSECHTNPNNYSIFDCTGCHSRGETDDDHDEVGGYVYQSTECLACHPNGDEDD